MSTDRYQEIRTLARTFGLEPVNADGRSYLTGVVLELEGTWCVYVADPEDSARERLSELPGWTLQVDDGSGTVPVVLEGLDLAGVLAELPRLIGTYGQACESCGAPVGEPCYPGCIGAASLEDDDPTTTTED